MGAGAGVGARISVAPKAEPRTSVARIPQAKPWTIRPPSRHEYCGQGVKRLGSGFSGPPLPMGRDPPAVRHAPFLRLQDLLLEELHQTRHRDVQVPVEVI